MGKISGELSLQAVEGGWLVTCKVSGETFGPYPVDRMSVAVEAATVAAGFPGGYEEVPGAFVEAHRALRAAEAEGKAERVWS
jgi:hypothetical protein